MLDDLGLLNCECRQQSPREGRSLFVVHKFHMVHDAPPQEVAYDPYPVSATETLSSPEIPQTSQTAADYRSTAPSRLASLGNPRARL
jgi:hypothetical protein